MKFFAIFVALMHGLLATFGLFAIQLIVAAFADSWTWPFSVWWGMLAALPGLGIAIFAWLHDL